MSKPADNVAKPETMSQAMPQEIMHNPMVGVRHFVRILLRHRWIIVLCVMLSGGIGALYYTTSERLYVSKAELYILDSGGTLLEKGESHQSLTDSMPTYERVLQSNVVIRNALQAIPEKHLVDFDDAAQNKWPEILLKSLKISQVRRTNVLQLEYTSKHPESAAVIVDALIESYLAFMKSTQQDSAEGRLELLTVEKRNLEKQIREKETQHLSLRGQTDVLFGEGDKNINMVNDRVVALNKAWVDAKQKSLDAFTFMNSVHRAIENGENIQEYAMQTSSNIGEEMLKRKLGVDNNDSWSIAQAQQQLLKDRADLENKRTKYGERHPAIQELIQKIQVTETWLTNRHSANSAAVTLSNVELAPQLMEMAQHKYQNCYAHEQAIYQQFFQEKQRAMNLNQQLAQLEILGLDLKRMRSYYDLLVDRIKDIDLGKQNSLQISIVGHPTINAIPVSPKFTLTVLFSLISGITLGAAIIYLIDMFDDRFRTADDLQAQLNLPILAMIRQFQNNGLSGLPGINTFYDPKSVESEGFRTLRTKIDFSGDEMRRISISSTEPSDGKTTVISNLAVTFAQSGRKTLIIDGDMRRPGLTKVFLYRGAKGLSTLLRDTRPYDEIFEDNVIHTEMPLLDVIPSGPRPINPVELLTDQRMSELLAWAESRYDRILIDAPPALAVADPAIIGRLVDGSVLTVRPDKNRKNMVYRAAESLGSLGANILGIVVNQLPPDSQEYGYGYGYNYSYGYGHDNHEQDEEQNQLDIEYEQEYVKNQSEPEVVPSFLGRGPRPLSEYENYYQVNKNSDTDRRVA
jgi:capsular exopolysaccharide synthesis family protein